MNFTRDAIECAPSHARALVELARDGSRREWTFGELASAAQGFAGALHERGVRRGDVVLTLIGNRPEWAIAMLACFRQGYVVLPCTEQLRAKDLEQRLAVAQPRIVVADPRNADLLGGREFIWRESAPAPPPGRPGPRGPVPDHVHLGHLGCAEGGPARPALSHRPAAPGRALARAGAGRPGLVHGGVGLVEVGPQRVHRPLAAGRRGAPARRPLRPARAAGADRPRARRRALHGADRVPRDRQARDAHRAAAEGPGGRRRGAQPRGPARLARGDRPVDPRRLRADGDRPADRLAARRDARARARWAARCRASSCRSSTANWS